jgi:hypothetical protein
MKSKPLIKKRVEVPLWLVGVGALLVPLCASLAFFMVQWRDLAMQRAGIDTAAEALCKDVLVTAANQAELLSGLNEVAQGATEGLQQCLADQAAEGARLSERAGG